MSSITFSAAGSFKNSVFSVVVLVVVAVFGSGQTVFPISLDVVIPVAVADDAALARALANRTGKSQVEGQGVVVKVLPDDNDGSRHQRFIIRLSSGQTILIAHNIDLAPRVLSLKAGDVVAFHGDYEWNSKGGVVHWTHRDPAGRHSAGWLKHNGQSYQ